MSPESIAQFFNRHSFVLMAAGLWLGLAVLLLRNAARREGPGVPAGNQAALLLVGAVLLAVWLTLRQGPGTHTDAAAVEAALGQGQPVLVEYYSDY